MALLPPIHIDIKGREGGTLPREWEDFFGAITRIFNSTTTGLTANRMVETDGDNVFASISDLTDYILETANQIVVTDNGNGTATISIDDGFLVGTTNEITVTNNVDGTVTLSRPNDVTDERLTIHEAFILSESDTVDITAVGGITPTHPRMHIQGAGGAITVTADPPVAAGTIGQKLFITGMSNTNTVTLNPCDSFHIFGKAIIGVDDTIVLHYDVGGWVEDSRNFTESQNSWAFKSPSGGSGTYYYGGYYRHAATDNDFNPAATFGTINAAYGAHFYMVQAAGGGAGTDTVYRVTGTSMTDEGVRAAGATEDITVDDAGAAGTYYETVLKWIGRVSVVKTAGPDLLVNYGFCKYWDNNNSDFRVTGIEATWLGGANDANANIGIRHHKATGWTYNNGAPATPPAYVYDMRTDYNTEVLIVNTENGSWKRDNAITNINGGGTEGMIVEIVTTANKAFDLGNILIRFRSSHVH